jgi:kojibiose phosphorylase
MSWLVRESDLEFDHPDVYSTLFCVGNGQACTRGTLGEERHEAYRGVYLAGLYTRAPWGLMYLMPAPDWLPVFVRTGNQAAMSTQSQRILDLRRGVLTRKATFAHDGVELRLEEDRFASFDDPHLMAQRFTVSVIAGAGRIQIVMGLDADVRSHVAKYYQPGQFPAVDPYGVRLAHVEHLAAGREGLEVRLKANASDSRSLATATVRQAAGPVLPRQDDAGDGLARAIFELDLAGHVGQTFVFEKLVHLGGTTDAHASRPTLAAPTITWDQASARHLAAIQNFWDLADVRIDGDDEAQLAVRYAIWSTRIAAPLDDGTSSIGAKNLSGDWYRGAVFWDMEMFQLPMLAAVDPARSRNQVLYRSRRLGSARILAAQDGYDGARYPWHSYATGLEEPPQLGGFLYQQQHVNLAVAWGILHHDDLADDTPTMLRWGLPTLIELCRFWASRVGPPDERGQYHIAGVCGPDENHPNVTDNAYTNRMVAWLLGRTDRLIDQLTSRDRDAMAAALEGMSVDDATRQRWRDVAAHLCIPMLRRNVLAACQGYGDLPEPNDALEGLGADKRSKQADTLMLFQAIPDELGRDAMEACYREYAPLSLQTSSLSLSTHALVAIRLGLLRDAMKFFGMTTGADLADKMGNTRDGIHGAAQGGIWMAAVWGFGGLAAGEGKLSIHPMLPPSWKSLGYRFMFQGQPIAVRIEPEHIEVENEGTRDVTIALPSVASAHAHTPTLPHVMAPRRPVRIAHKAAWRDEGLGAVIFDLDGVLVSTDRYHYVAWKELATRLGLPFDEERNHLLRGVSREESLKIIYGDRPPPPADQFKAQCDAKNERYKALVAAMTPADVLPGAIDLLRALRAAGVKIGIASASRNCDLVLQRTGLAQHVDAVSDGNVISASKPDPSGFFVASQRLRVLPWNCVGVEDAAAGIEAIHRAGMAALGIGPQAAGADVVAPDIAHVSLGVLRDLFEHHQSDLDPYLQRSLAHINMEVKSGYAATLSFGQKK